MTLQIRQCGCLFTAVRTCHHGRAVISGLSSMVARIVSLPAECPVQSRKLQRRFVSARRIGD